MAGELQTSFNKLDELRVKEQKLKSRVASSLEDAKSLENVAARNVFLGKTLFEKSRELRERAEEKYNKTKTLLKKEKALVKKINTLVEAELMKQTEAVATALQAQYSQFKIYASKNAEKPEITLNIVLTNTEIFLSHEVKINYGDYADTREVLVSIADLGINRKYQYKENIHMVADRLESEIPALMADIFGKKVYDMLAQADTNKKCKIDVYLAGYASGPHIGGPEPETRNPPKVVFILDESFSKFNVKGIPYPRLGGALSAALKLVEDANKV